jgi:hypothetical protein
VAKKAAGVALTVFLAEEKMFFVAKKMRSEAIKIFPTAEKMFSVAETVV